MAVIEFDVSRFVLVTTKQTRMPAQKRPTDWPKYLAAYERLQAQLTRPGTKIAITPEASEMFDAWWRSTPRDKASEIRIDDMMKRMLLILAITNDTDVVDAKLMDQAISFGVYEIALREKFNPADASSWTQAFENDLIRVFKRWGEMTANQARRRIHPEEKPGGLGPFNQAFRNLVQGEVLQQVGRTEKGTQRFRLG